MQPKIHDFWLQTLNSVIILLSGHSSPFTKQTWGKNHIMHWMIIMLPWVYRFVVLKTPGAMFTSAPHSRDLKWMCRGNHYYHCFSMTADAPTGSMRLHMVGKEKDLILGEKKKRKQKKTQGKQTTMESIWLYREVLKNELAKHWLANTDALHGFGVDGHARGQGTDCSPIWTFCHSCFLWFRCDGEFNPRLEDKVKWKTGDDQMLEGNSPSALAYPMAPPSVIAHLLFTFPLPSPAVSHFQMLCSLACTSSLIWSSWHPALGVCDEIGLNGVTSLAMKLRADFSAPSLSHPLFLTTHPPPALGCFNVMRC